VANKILRTVTNKHFGYFAPLLDYFAPKSPKSTKVNTQMFWEKLELVSTNGKILCRVQNHWKNTQNFNKKC